ncbi:MAG: hypothetical protein ACJ75T_01910 [Solirubrobacterales bacterium]
MDISFQRFTLKLKPEVSAAVDAEFAAAVGTVGDATDAPDVQIAELRRLAAVLETGSSSLNQRATTLAGLAVAGIGTFGLFAGKLAEIHGADARELVAIALVAASVFLAISAGFALLAVLPGGKWGRSFAEEAQPVIQGELGQRGQKSAAMVKSQLKRNSEKAIRMRWAYRSTAVALIAVVVAVVAVALQEAGTPAAKHDHYSPATSAALTQLTTEEASAMSQVTVLSIAVLRVRQQHIIALFRGEPAAVVGGYEAELAALRARLDRVRKDEARLEKVIARLRDGEAPR